MIIQHLDAQLVKSLSESSFSVLKTSQQVTQEDMEGCAFLQRSFKPLPSLSKTDRISLRIVDCKLNRLSFGLFGKIKKKITKCGWCQLLIVSITSLYLWLIVTAVVFVWRVLFSAPPFRTIFYAIINLLVDIEFWIIFDLILIIVSVRSLSQLSSPNFLFLACVLN